MKLKKRIESEMFFESGKDTKLAERRVQLTITIEMKEKSKLLWRQCWYNNDCTHTHTMKKRGHRVLVKVPVYLVRPTCVKPQEDATKANKESSM